MQNNKLSTKQFGVFETEINDKVEIGNYVVVFNITHKGMLHKLEASIDTPAMARPIDHITQKEWITPSLRGKPTFLDVSCLFGTLVIDENGQEKLCDDGWMRVYLNTTEYAYCCTVGSYPTYRTLYDLKNKKTKRQNVGK